MEIPRIYNIEEILDTKKVLILFGPRQAGKTTLLQNYMDSSCLKTKFVTGDDIQTQTTLSSSELKQLKEFVEGYDILIVDEAQRIPQIGRNLKLLKDHLPNLKIIATGSSSFELSGQVGEPLTGRKKTLTLFPISQMELAKDTPPSELKEKLEEYLIYGSYPEVLTTESKDEKATLLKELTQSYLFKDILELERIKSSKTLIDLLRLLAFQIGNEVSHNELAINLKIDPKTVTRYLDLLEKSFIIYNLRGFSRNLRKEITKKSMYYFYDTGIRNAVIANLNPIELRNDIGQLWENFLIMERLKKRTYQNILTNDYFWRTWDQKEIDLIEEREGKLFAYEIKWKSNRKIKTTAPKDWQENYPNSEYKVITQENFLEFVT